jgi:stage V sporulation protein AA
MDIYIKPQTKLVVSKRFIKVSDVAEVMLPPNTARDILDTQVLRISAEKKGNYIVSALDLIKLIKRQLPDAHVINVGADDTIIAFAPDKKERNKILQVIMIVFVTLTLMAGSATAIMSFHTDAQLSKVFSKYYSIFFGKESDKPLIIDIPYSIGLAAGIIIFFNHFLGKKLTQDPTPIEVEMTAYDKEVTDSIIDSLEKNEKKRRHSKDEGENS